MLKFCSISNFSEGKTPKSKLSLLVKFGVNGNDACQGLLLLSGDTVLRIMRLSNHVDPGESNYIEKKKEKRE